MQILNLPILIRWDKFAPGTSFFIPCIDRGGMERMIRHEARRLEVAVVCKQVVENGRYGLRVWRSDGTLPPHSTSKQEA
jgi:hypothetical protein